MPAIDLCHLQVVHALEKAGWVIVASPLTLETSINDLFVDILASLVSENETQRIIVVEIKCFTDTSSQMNDLYVAIGQYLVYRDLLAANGITDSLYLAIPSKAYYGIFRSLGMTVALKTQIKLIVIDIDQEEIELWSES